MKKDYKWEIFSYVQIMELCPKFTNLNNSQPLLVHNDWNFQAKFIQPSVSKPVTWTYTKVHNTIFIRIWENHITKASNCSWRAQGLISSTLESYTSNVELKFQLAYLCNWIQTNSKANMPPNPYTALVCKWWHAHTRATMKRMTQSSI